MRLRRKGYRVLKKKSQVFFLCKKKELSLDKGKKWRKKKNKKEKWKRGVMLSLKTLVLELPHAPTC